MLKFIVGLFIGVAVASAGASESKWIQRLGFDMRSASGPTDTFAAQLGADGLWRWECAESK